MGARVFPAAAAAVVCAGLAVPVAKAQATAKPLATVATNTNGVSIDLMAVERKGSILTVKWAARNAGANSATVQYALTGQSQTTYALDEDSGTKYYALTDKEKNTLASEHVYLGGNTFGINEDVDGAGVKRFWAKFPAPPPAVKTISIFFTDAEPIEAVAITDK